jgi:NADH-quinone oxidoreductase subunit H
VRWSFVRIRVDQILTLSWKALMPATLALLVLTAIVVVWRG